MMLKRSLAAFGLGVVVVGTGAAAATNTGGPFAIKKVSVTTTTPSFLQIPRGGTGPTVKVGGTSIPGITLSSNNYRKDLAEVIAYLLLAQGSVSLLAPSRSLSAYKLKDSPIAQLAQGISGMASIQNAIMVYCLALRKSKYSLKTTIGVVALFSAIQLYQLVISDQYKEGEYSWKPITALMASLGAVAYANLGPKNDFGMKPSKFLAGLAVLGGALWTFFPDFTAEHLALMENDLNQQEEHLLRMMGTSVLGLGLFLTTLIYYGKQRDVLHGFGYSWVPMALFLLYDVAVTQKSSDFDIPREVTIGWTVLSSFISGVLSLTK